MENLDYLPDEDLYKVSARLRKQWKLLTNERDREQNALLRHYCGLVRCARTARLNGAIEAALRYEQAMDDAYNALDESHKW